MPSQLQLSFNLPTLEPLKIPVGHRGMSIPKRFEVFHRNNPHVYRALRKLALDMKAKGCPRYGMKGLFEILRWTYAIQTNGEEYKLNNNYTAFYARMLVEEEPSLRGFFALRKQRAAEVA